jgi:autotransporter adhesin
MNTANSAVLSNAEAYTNSRLMGLDVEVGNVQRNADAGTASAMALAGVPQAFQPGKSMIAAGVGTYGSQSALALGLSTLSEDGRWVIKLDGSANTRGKYGGSVGAGLSW